MALAVVYTTINGQIVHENRGGVERAYMPDTLGSTAALLDSSQNKTDEWRYWPYGEVASRTGSNVTPFTFVGTLGYFKDMLDKLLYVRARHYQPNHARWLTVDVLWPTEMQFVYCLASPINLVDPGGQAACGGPGQACCVCMPSDYPTGELARCTACASAAGFDSLAAFCKAYRDWKSKEPPAPWLALFCCKRNDSNCRGKAERACPKGMKDRDKCLHCVTSCCFAKACGKSSARYCGWCHEMRQLLDCKDTGIFDPGDHKSNEWGIDYSNQPCNVACKKYGAV